MNRILHAVLFIALFLSASCSSNSGKMTLNLGEPIFKPSDSFGENPKKGSNEEDYKRAYQVATTWFEVVPGESVLSWKPVMKGNTVDSFLDLKIRLVKNIYLNTYYMDKHGRVPEDPIEHFMEMIPGIRLIDSEGDDLLMAYRPEMYSNGYDMKKGEFIEDKDRLQELYDFATTAKPGDEFVWRFWLNTWPWKYDTEAHPSFRRIIKEKLISGIEFYVSCRNYGWDFVGEDLWGNAEKDAAIKAAAEKEREAKRQALKEEQSRKARNWLHGGK